MPDTEKALKLIQNYTSSLTQAKTEGEVCWELTKNVIANLGFEDCVVYLFDPVKQVLVQKAAHGPKNPISLDILNPITIKPGHGIVGSVFISAEHEIVQDTSLDERYIVDDQSRMSEIAVPLISRGKAIGVIDSENTERGFYTDEHLSILSTLASITSNKIIETRAFSRLEELNEALHVKHDDLMEKNEEMSVLNQQMDELVYRLSHDFRSPIVSIISVINVLEKSPEKIQELLPHAKNKLSNMDWVLRNIYYYSDSLRRSLNIEEINFDDLLETSIAAVREVSDKEVSVQFENTSGQGLFTDAWALHIFLVNAIHNSLTFGGKPEDQIELKLELLRNEQGLVLRFSDNGIGFPKEFQTSKNEMFKRRSLQSEGAGFGFFLCRTLAKKIHAEFSISTSENGVVLQYVFP
jgi:K+-sensing histidine kinase KdpD